ncbi:hypothetical protein VCB98_02780 [Gammaproteobacteria bacterium AB-CW1]|uniref:Lipoprotein n=1 Tax=Natronospira elongata TaxID=3110268 RepID=A0AAP6JD16_9GAMM|nr:hypothetical protein [Gammaproteobacteria bacterium AB-CW1]
MEQRRGITLIGLTCLLAFTTACAGFIQDRQTRDRQARIERAIQDDATCRQQGREFPSTAYTRCRQSLQDQREWRQLRALEILEPEPMGAGVRDPFHRPSSERGDFRCEKRRWEETEWIECGVYPN